MNHYTDREWLEQKYWGEELSTYQLAALCNVTKNTISNWMKRYGIARRVFSEANKIVMKHYKAKAWLKQRYSEEELSTHQLATLCNVDKNTIRKWMDKHNITRRSLSEANKIISNRPEIKNGNRERAKEKWANPEYRKRQSEGHKKYDNQPGTKKIRRERAKQLWQNPEYIKKSLKALEKKPTNPEKVFDDMTPEIVRYTGNRAWWRKLDDGKNHNPDFKVTGQYKVIEIFGDYWHKGEDPQELIDLYALAGIECLIFWEHEVYEKPQQVMERTHNFIESRI